MALEGLNSLHGGLRSYPQVSKHFLVYRYVICQYDVSMCQFALAMYFEVSDAWLHCDAFCHYIL